MSQRDYDVWRSYNEEYDELVITVQASSPEEALDKAAVQTALSGLWIDPEDYDER